MGKLFLWHDSKIIKLVEQFYPFLNVVSNGIEMNRNIITVFAALYACISNELAYDWKLTNK